MNTKQKLAYIAIGGLLVATGMIISPLNAQKDKFGDIECESLKVTGRFANRRAPRRWGQHDYDWGCHNPQRFPTKTQHEDRHQR